PGRGVEAGAEARVFQQVVVPAVTERRRNVRRAALRLPLDRRTAGAQVDGERLALAPGNGVDHAAVRNRAGDALLLHAGELPQLPARAGVIAEHAVRSGHDDLRPAVDRDGQRAAPIHGGVAVRLPPRRPGLGI